MRPSLQRRLRVTVESLSREERAIFDQFRHGAVLNEQHASSLDAYALFLQAEKQRKGKWSEEKRFREVLVARSRASKKSKPLEFGGEKTRPDLSHGSYRVGLGPSFHERAGIWRVGAELDLHFAYHDLLDADPGYMPHSQFMWPNFRIRFLEKQVRLEEAELFSMVSLSPWDLVRKPIAWRAKLAYQSFLDLPCETCRGLRVEGGPGAAWSVIAERWTLWSILGMRADFAESLPNTARFQAWAEFGSLYTLPNEGKILLELRPVWGTSPAGRAPWQLEFRGGVSQSLGLNWALRSEAVSIHPLRKAARAISELRLLTLRYF
jgi:hypothetical protein